jgi:hypothetical protein
MPRRRFFGEECLLVGTYFSGFCGIEGDLEERCVWTLATQWKH